MPDRQAEGPAPGIIGRVLTEAVVAVRLERVDYSDGYQWRIDCQCGATQGPSISVWYSPRNGDGGLPSATRRAEVLASQAAAEAFILWAGGDGKNESSEGQGADGGSHA